ncbi:MAG TPA: ribosome recycling factor [Dehalococcoidia bacterium]|jgi:ribosome recycling factor|nr:ribosome recycling factor [Dehalococcoidia bacterium]
MIDDVFNDAKDRMTKAVDALRRELATIRTGRAHPGLVEHLRVDYYGVPTPLNQLATISVPDPRLLTIQPWDRQAMGAIEKAILKSDLSLTPSNDGVIIRLSIPQLTEERRRELAKVVHKKVEEGRVEVRNIRRDGHEELRRLQREKLISEDDQFRGQEKLQKLTDEYVQQVERVGEEKEAELLAV